MEKTNLGIRENIFATLLFILGLTGFLPVLIFAVVAFVLHENDYIKKTALQSIGFLLIIAFINIILVCLNGAVNFTLQPVFNLFPFGIKGVTSEIYRNLRNLVTLIQYIGIFVLSYKAYRGKPIHIPFIDEIIEKSL